MGRRAHSPEEQPADGGDEEGGRPRSKLRGRLAKVVFLGGIVAVAARPQLRNKLLDALFGPEEQFEYESPTEPISYGIESDESEVSWPAGAAAEDEGPPWTFTEHAEWAASASVPYEADEPELAGFADEAPLVDSETPGEGGAAGADAPEAPSYRDAPSSYEPQAPSYADLPSAEEPEPPPSYGDTAASHEPPSASYGADIPASYEPSSASYEADTPASYEPSSASYEADTPAPPYEPSSASYEADTPAPYEPEPPSYRGTYEPEPPSSAVEDDSPPPRAFAPDEPAEVTELSSYRIETVVSGSDEVELDAEEDAASDWGVPASESAAAAAPEVVEEVTEIFVVEEPAPTADAAAEASPEPEPAVTPAEEPSPAPRPAIGEATPPPLIAWWRSRRRKAPGPGEAPEPPRWE